MKLAPDIAILVILICGLAWLIFQPAKPKPINTLTQEQQLRIWTEAHNKQQKEIRELRTELDQVKRQLAGELPQIQGGVSYETK